MSKTEYRYWRMEAQGNAFLILDARGGKLPPSAHQVRVLAEKTRKEKKPFDQLLVLEPSQHAPIFMRIFNQDGGEVEVCGNGVCAVARLSIDAWGKPYERGPIETLSANHRIHIMKLQEKNSAIFSIGVEIRYPRFGWKEIPLKWDVPNTKKVSLDPPVFADGKELPPFFAVNVGNPHAVFFFDDRNTMPSLEKVGKELEHHPIFPERANISFVSFSRQSPEFMKWRVWERGVGITKSCGTGACAVAVAMLKADPINLKSLSGTERVHTHNIVIPSSQGEMTVALSEDTLLLFGKPQYAYETKCAKDVHHLTLPEVS